MNYYVLRSQVHQLSPGGFNTDPRGITDQPISRGLNGPLTARIRHCLFSSARLRPNLMHDLHKTGRSLVIMTLSTMHN